MLINQTFKVGRKVGGGNFGQIYLGKNVVTNADVAIKLERVQAYDMLESLAREHNIYEILRTQKGIPEIFYFGQLDNKNQNVLVMELLGPSLENLFEMCHRKFSIKTVAMIASQLIERLEYIHSRSIVFQDVKPDNFVIGSPSRRDIIYVIDFGLSKLYKNKHDQHIPYSEHSHLTGTARYMSIRAHSGKEQSRRDDLEALGYMLMYFLRGSLPWQGLRLDKSVTYRDRFKKIAEVKQKTPLKDLCMSYPREFAIFIKYSKNLEFTESPNYDKLKRLFRDIVVDSTGLLDWDFDWNHLPMDIYRAFGEDDGHGLGRYPARDRTSRTSKQGPSPLNSNDHPQMYQLSTRPSMLTARVSISPSVQVHTRQTSAPLPEYIDPPLSENSRGALDSFRSKIIELVHSDRDSKHACQS